VCSSDSGSLGLGCSVSDRSSLRIVLWVSERLALVSYGSHRDNLMSNSV
jgi:hypothetical protein